MDVATYQAAVDYHRELMARLYAKPAHCYDVKRIRLKNIRFVNSKNSPRIIAAFTSHGQRLMRSFTLTRYNGSAECAVKAAQAWLRRQRVKFF